MSSEDTNKRVEGEVTDSPVSSSSSSTANSTPSDNLGIKYVDSRWSDDPSGWKYEDTSKAGEVPAEKVQPQGLETSSDDSWEGFCFVVVRKHPKPQEGKEDNAKRQITFEIVIKSPHLLSVCKEVMCNLRGVSWTSAPVTVRPSLSAGVSV